MLLVEDNKVNQLLARTLLRKASMEVTIAEHGRAAVDLLTAPGERYDVVLMDVQMPVMDGLE
ncbi:MAG TPA: response regulator, partial [Kofleriaceae bacterium]|nr:response regulator [Kofleriaceae bacterium]